MLRSVIMTLLLSDAGIMGAIECHRLFGDEVVISVPIEGDLIPLSQLMPIQLSATSDHEYYGPMIPRVMRLLHEGKYDDATEIYWQLHPARKAKSGLAPSLHGGGERGLGLPGGMELPVDVRGRIELAVVQQPHDARDHRPVVLVVAGRRQLDRHQLGQRD